ncbi:helix-turn-helix domain-containing protein [Nonomuraea sp. NPDC059007]|uniref:helix-turn-helix domain-containing protein n=1 Tax=Nonomuraea sp. NPDC059007 TaxID=3346692 RepID=UPI0036AE7DB8
MGSAEIPIGERIRFYRTARNKTQAVVAGLAGMSENYLSQIERGLRTPTIALLHQLARVLDVPVAVLIGEPSLDGDSVLHPVAGQLQRVLTAYEAPPDASPDLPALRARVESAWGLWQGSTNRFTEVSTLIPDLTRDVQGAVRALRTSTDATSRREAYQVSADLYFLLRTFTKRVGRTDLSLMVADRAVTASENADDPLRIAAAKWNLGQILLSQGEPEGAEDVAIRSIEDLRREVPERQPDQAALEGALWLVAAIASGRRHDHWTARERIQGPATEAAREAGEGNVFWTVFGSLNVGLHLVSVEMEAGEVAEALYIADQLDVNRSPSLERRMTFALEVARCYDQRQEDAAVILHLMNAEASGPEDLRYNTLARDLVRSLLKRARPTFQPQVRALARRVGLLE